MFEITFKPFRKPAHLIGVTDDEIYWKMEARKKSPEVIKSLGKKKLHVGLPLEASIVSDSIGMIENILLTVPPYYDQKNPSEVIDPFDKKHLFALIQRLSKHKRHYTIVCHANQVKVVQGWFRAHKIHSDSFTLCISVFSYSIWAQDAYVALNTVNNDILLCEGICFTRDHDMTVADDLAHQTNIKKHPSYLYFQGGNILATTKYVLVGRDYVVENAGRVFLETEKKVLRAFSELFNRPVLAIGRQKIIPGRDREHLGGGLFQPIFHLDMYVSPTGVKNRKGKEVIFVGSPKLARKILGEKSKETDHDQYFDETAEQLARYFHVIRMPLYPTRFRTRPHESSRFYFLTYNNVIIENFIENRKTIRHVYLPGYSADVRTFRSDSYLAEYHGCEKKYGLLDQAAARAWRDLGFKVHKMDGLENLAMSWGSVHCMAKILRRTPE